MINNYGRRNGRPRAATPLGPPPAGNNLAQFPFQWARLYCVCDAGVSRRASSRRPREYALRLQAPMNRSIRREDHGNWRGSTSEGHREPRESRTSSGAGRTREPESFLHYNGQSSSCVSSLDRVGSNRVKLTRFASSRFKSKRQVRRSACWPVFRTLFGCRRGWASVSDRQVGGASERSVCTICGLGEPCESSTQEPRGQCASCSSAHRRARPYFLRPTTHTHTITSH